MEEQFKECLLALSLLGGGVKDTTWRKQLIAKTEHWLDAWLVFYKYAKPAGRYFFIQTTAEVVQCLEGLITAKQLATVPALDTTKRLLTLQSNLLRQSAFKPAPQRATLPRPILKPIIPLSGTTKSAARIPVAQREQLRGSRAVNNSIRGEILDIISQFEEGCEPKEVVELLGSRFSARTVYRYLGMLDKSGEIKRSWEGPGFRYMLTH